MAMLKRPNYLVFMTVCFLIFASASIVHAQENRVIERLSSEKMKSLLQSEGFTDIEITSNDDLIVKMQGFRIAIFVRGGDYSRIKYFFITDANMTLRDVNDWNREKTFTKAYLDNDGDLVLEMDVDLYGGVTIARIKDSIRTYNMSLLAFILEIYR